MASPRKVPSQVQLILNWDAYLTEKLCTKASTLFDLKKHEYLLKILEISCHGLPWLAVWMAFIWIFWNESLFQMQVNLFIGLVVDLLAVALMKAYFRRRRPTNNKQDMMFSKGPDVYSFPSGHVSRAFLIAHFFYKLYPLSSLSCLCMYAWAVSILLSRVLLRRHYLLDVVGGLAVSCVLYVFLSTFYLSQSTTLWIIEYLTDEKFDGGEYHHHHEQED